MGALRGALVWLRVVAGMMNGNEYSFESVERSSDINVWAGEYES